MIRDIVVDEDLMQLKSVEAVGRRKILQVVRDLLDTGESMRDRCAGLAANQIGELYRICIVKWGIQFIALVNPKVLEASEQKVPFLEGCLSRPGRPPVKCMRHKWVRLEYTDPEGNVVQRKFKGHDARCVQHEMDHFEGVLI